MSSAVADHGTAAYRNAVMPVVRVAVLTTDDSGGARMTDIALPAELPLRELIPAVRRLVAPADDAGGAAAPVSLAPIGGAPFSLDATLTTAGVASAPPCCVSGLAAAAPSRSPDRTSSACGRRPPTSSCSAPSATASWCAPTSQDSEFTGAPVPARRTAVGPRDPSVRRRMNRRLVERPAVRMVRRSPPAPDIRYAQVGPVA